MSSIGGLIPKFGTEKTSADWRAIKRGTRPLRPPPTFARRIPNVDLPPLVGTSRGGKFMLWGRSTIFRNCSLKHSRRCRLHWKTHFQTEVCSGSSHQPEAMPWMKEVEMATPVDDLMTSRSITRRIYPTHDARIATKLKNIIQNSILRWKVHLEEQKAQKEDDFSVPRRSCMWATNTSGWRALTSLSSIYLNWWE